MRALLSLSVAALLGACVVRVQPFVHHAPPSGVVVAVERVHVHSAACGHYWFDGRWYFHSGHVHAVGCGHVFQEGTWVLAAPVVVEKVHVHDAYCGHYFHGGAWFYMHGHRHGPGCGHHWNGSLWVAVKF